jgi:hypothetical protein
LVWQVLPPEQSRLPQHPELATQRVPQSFGADVGQPHWLLWQTLLPPHWELVVHWTHCPPEQNGVLPLQSLDVQQAVVAMHVSLAAQYFCPPRHFPEHAAVCAIQAPSQSWGAAAFGQVWTHAVPLQVTLPPVGCWQGVVHSVSPHVARALLLTHVPLQLWYPELQRTEHAPFWQIAVPFGSAGHFMHVDPQALGSSSAAHVLPHWWRPVVQVNPQTPLIQLVLAEPSGAGQGVHEAPQEAGAVSEAQTPLQLCVPAGQLPQTAVASMQAPLQSFCVPGHAPPQTPAVQVAVPPVIVGHGVHEVPQLAGSVSLRHFFTSAQ